MAYATAQCSSYHKQWMFWCMTPLQLAMAAKPILRFDSI